MLLAREEKWSLTRLKGSYAGAMGMGQFMPSSYRHYAVDFDGDGKRDLFANPVDAIGSVAHYFAEHQWRWGVAGRTRLDRAGASGYPAGACPRADPDLGRAGHRRH